MFYTETIKENCEKAKKIGCKKFFALCLAGFIFGIFSGITVHYSLSRQDGSGNLVYSTDYVVSITASNGSPYTSVYGSGVIFHETDDKVFVVTNYHVVENAGRVSVSLGGSPSVSARILGYEAGVDLAVLFLRKDALAELGVEDISIPSFADSDKLRVGDTVLAVGNAHGQGSVMTRGIISATERAVPAGDRQYVFLQTDAAINDGSSGGALLNANGEVIGIATAKMRYRESGKTLDGIGFCIPINRAKASIESIMNKEKIPFLGIAGLAETSAAAGILVEAVVPRSSAADGGLRRGDLITAFNGETLSSMGALEEKMSACDIGDRIELEIIREGAVLVVNITLSDYNSLRD